MAIDVTNIGGPIIASRSRVNEDTRKFGTFTATHSQTLLRRITDGDPESFWHDEGDGDATPSVLELSVQLRTAIINQPVNVIAIQNINWKRFKVEYSATGGAPFTIIPELDFTGVDNTDTDLIVAPDLFTANYYKITIESAFGDASPNEFKRLGGFYPCLNILQPLRGLMSNPRSDRSQVRKNTLADGSEHRQFRLRSAVSHKHYQSSPTFQLMSDDELKTMNDMSEQGVTFTWIPEPGSRNRIVRTCQFDGPIKEDYETSFRGSGHRVKAKVSELGRL